VFVGYSGTVATLSEALGRPCHWLPGAVDAVRFSPYPRPAERVVDIYSIGRRWDPVHAALLKLAAKKEIFYLHDSFVASDTEVADHRQHRDLLANIAKRSHYFIVAPAKMDLPGETKGQVEIGYRFYEGAAAGCVLLGRRPQVESFEQLFDWSDAVIEIKVDGSDVVDTIMGLHAEPDRVHQIRGRNAAQALLRHDWAYRWKQMLGVAGIPPSPGMAAREARLKELACLAMYGD